METRSLGKGSLRLKRKREAPPRRDLPFLIGQRLGYSMNGSGPSIAIR
jgi:hypothetical protein